MKKNHYQVLEVEPDASAERIKEQYLFLVQAWHPDKFSSADQKARAGEMTQQINAAYDVLREPTKRAKYDAQLQASKKTEGKQPPPRQARRPAAAPAQRKAPSRAKGLFGSLGVYGRETQGSRDQIRVFLNGRARYLSVDELAHATVQYALHGQSMGEVTFQSPQHVQAAVNTVVIPRGYEIHVLRLAPYGSRPEMVFPSKVRPGPGR